MIIDTHCHLDHKKFDNDRIKVIKKIIKSSISNIITVGCSLESSMNAKNLAIVHDFIYFAAGIHPNNATSNIKSKIKILHNLSIHKKCVAIGECGLDYYANNTPSRKTQENTFIKQIELANNIKKTLIIHIRNAWDDCLNILKKYNKTLPVIIHCFTGNMNNANKCIDQNYYISFSGILTFNNVTILEQIVKITPLDKILIETDSPYLAPTPFRGTRNEPIFIFKIAKKIAKLKKIKFKKLIEITKNNSIKAFRLKPNIK